MSGSLLRVSPSPVNLSRYKRCFHKTNYNSNQMLNTLLQGCIFVKATKVLRMSQQKLIETIHYLMDHLTLFLRNISTTVKNRNHVCLLVFHFIFYKLFEANVPLHRFQYSSFYYSLSISKIGILLRYILSTFPNCCLYSILYLELTKN